MSLTPELQAVLECLQPGPGTAFRHGNYQEIPPGLPDEFYRQLPEYPKTRLDSERFRWMAEHADFKGRSLLEIGGNLGYFSIRALRDAEASHSVIYEPVEQLAKAGRALARAFGIADRLEVRTVPVHLDSLGELPRVDLIINLNVLHHAGHDFATDEVRTRDEWWDYARRTLSGLGQVAPAMIFQTGFNWGGSPVGLCDKHEGVTEWTTRLVKEAGWRVRAIGVGRSTPAGWTYGPPAHAGEHRDVYAGPGRLTELKKWIPPALLSPVRRARKSLFGRALVEQDLRTFAMRPILVCER